MAQVVCLVLCSMLYGTYYDYSIISRSVVVSLKSFEASIIPLAATKASTSFTEYGVFLQEVLDPVAQVFTGMSLT